MADENKIAEMIVQITARMDMLLNDTSVPKNVRTAIAEAKAKLNEKGDDTVRIASAIYSIDGVSNDINLPAQARTMLWSILSMLEAIKE
ncbi:MAG: UPF0147 family protein [Candidatus Marsarchaeota archaeon]|jgi:uncharacterized protein (UPF0147 family)|nr:UPF0147 family protein [Candidatus Marsarchaeota archaeon]MCL5111433.1 UPF0147 family protein [Candidatus Marsarchaeota archaeon]